MHAALNGIAARTEAPQVEAASGPFGGGHAHGPALRAAAQQRGQVVGQARRVPGLPDQRLNSVAHNLGYGADVRDDGG